MMKVLTGDDKYNYAEELLLKKGEQITMDTWLSDTINKAERKGERKGALKTIEILYKLNLPFLQIVESLMDSFGYTEKEAKKAIHSLYPELS